jgi:hypothetical protein
VIVNYTSQSLEAAKAAPIDADLNEAGVEVVNQVLQNYLEDGDPMLRFEVDNADVGPVSPSPSDSLKFTWEACIEVHILYREELEVPDPF